MNPEAFHREMVAWMLGQGLVLITLMAGLVRWLLAREEDRLISKMGDKLTETMQCHQRDEMAHQAVVDRWELSRDRRLDAILLHVGERIASTLKDQLTISMGHHDASPHAHTAMAEHTHAPILALIEKLNDRLDSIDRKLTDLAARVSAR